MAIKTSTFSGWQLTDEHAEALLKHIDDPTPNPAAQAACERGDLLAEEFLKNGYVRMKPRESKKP